MEPTPTARGFTLIETVVTLGVFAVMVVLYAATLSTAPLTTASGHEDVALRIANQKIDDLRAGGYAALPASGPFADSQLASLPSGSASTSITTYNAKTEQVVVQVSWLEGGTHTQLVSLATLITQVGGLSGGN